MKRRIIIASVIFVVLFIVASFFIDYSDLSFNNNISIYIILIALVLGLMALYISKFIGVNIRLKIAYTLSFLCPIFFLLGICFLVFKPEWAPSYLSLIVLVLIEISMIQVIRSEKKRKPTE